MAQWGSTGLREHPFGQIGPADDWALDRLALRPGFNVWAAIAEVSY